MRNSAGRYIATEAVYAPDKYYRYAELTQLLEDWCARYRDLMVVESIGRSYEGRDIWGVTLTNIATGPAHEKPAYHIDANIHAGEITGSAVVLYTINWLLTNYGSEQRATWILDNLAIYLVPRICVDGAELYMTSPTYLRSSVRPYPEDDANDDRDGLRRKDLDGDGFIRTMRVRDATGPWKVSDKDPRVMVKRAPDSVICMAGLTSISCLRQTPGTATRHARRSNGWSSPRPARQWRSPASRIAAASTERRSYSASDGAYQP